VLSGSSELIQGSCMPSRKADPLRDRSPRGRFRGRTWIRKRAELAHSGGNVWRRPRPKPGAHQAPSPKTERSEPKKRPDDAIGREQSAPGCVFPRGQQALAEGTAGPQLHEMSYLPSQRYLPFGQGPDRFKFSLVAWGCSAEKIDHGINSQSIEGLLCPMQPSRNISLPWSISMERKKEERARAGN